MEMRKKQFNEKEDFQILNIMLNGHEIQSVRIVYA